MGTPILGQRLQLCSRPALAAGLYAESPNTTPWLPVFSNDDTLISFGSVTNNRILAGSVMQIALTTDSNANVEKMTFTVTDRAATSPAVISMFRSTGCFRSPGLSSMW